MISRGGCEHDLLSGPGGLASFVRRQLGVRLLNRGDPIP
jgi:hypothetical protein